MKNIHLISLLLLCFLIEISPSQSNTNHFGTGGVFELDLGDSEIALTPKQERKQKLEVDWIKLESQSFCLGSRKRNKTDFNLT